jgi:hypothetical protein
MRGVPASEVNLIEVAVLSRKLEAVGADCFVGTLYADVQPEVDLRVHLKPIAAEIAFCFLFAAYTSVHAITIKLYSKLTFYYNTNTVIS